MKVLIIVLLFAACSVETSGTNSSSSGGETYEWNLGYNTAEDSVRVATAETFKEIVEEKTDGRVTVNIFAGETLGSGAEMLERVNSGALENYN